MPVRASAWKRLAQHQGTDEVGGCSFDPFAPKPCLEAKREYDKFIAEHGLPDDHMSARAFSAYVDGQRNLGDWLYAKIKDIPIEQVANPGGQPNRLMIDIHPGQ